VIHIPSQALPRFVALPESTGKHVFMLLEDVIRLHLSSIYFENAGKAEYLLASADWMPRNLDRRVEIAFPVLDTVLQAQIREILDIQLADTVKARRILPDGRSMHIRADGESALRSQERLYEANGAGGILACPSDRRRPFHSVPPPSASCIRPRGI
jgi:polyphosphate kinase